jgi:hypothetical protein
VKPAYVCPCCLLPVFIAVKHKCVTRARYSEAALAFANELEELIAYYQWVKAQVRVGA